MSYDPTDNPTVWAAVDGAADGAEDPEPALVGDMGEQVAYPAWGPPPPEDAPVEVIRRWTVDRNLHLDPGVTVVIPSIPPRAGDGMLARAIASVAAQELPAAGIIVALDSQHEGAGPTRTRALRQVQTRWTAFLDDDDELYPWHLADLWALHERTGADVCVPWFDVIGGADPFPKHRGNLFDDPNKKPEDHRIFPITYLVRTAVAQACQFPKPNWGAADWAGDDYPFILRMHALGAKFAELPADHRTTWAWHHHGYGQPGRSGNTSGDPSRW